MIKYAYFRRIPPELRRQHPGKDIIFRMQRHNSDYKYILYPFSGVGQRLGYIMPPLITDKDTATSATSSDGTFKCKIPHKTCDRQCLSKNFQLSMTTVGLFGHKRMFPSRSNSDDIVFIAMDLLKLAQDAVELKENEPSTRLQIRFPDGGRVVGIFNLTHTVQSVRNFIIRLVSLD